MLKTSKKNHFKKQIAVLINFYKLFGVSVRNKDEKIFFYCEYIFAICVWAITVIGYTRGTLWLLANFQNLLNATFIVLVISIQMSTMPSIYTMAMYILKGDQIHEVLKNFDEIDQLLLEEGVILNYKKFAGYGVIVSIFVLGIMTITELLYVLTSAQRNNLPFYAYDYLFISETVVLPAAPLLQFALAVMLCKKILMKVNERIHALKRSSRNLWMDFSVTDDFSVDEKLLQLYLKEDNYRYVKPSQNLQVRVSCFKKLHKASCQNKLTEFQNLFKIHKKLMILVKNMMKFYGFLISLNMFRFATSIVPSTNQVIFADQDIVGDGLMVFKVIGAFSSIQRLVFLFWIAHTCESVLEQVNIYFVTYSTSSSILKKNLQRILGLREKQKIVKTKTDLLQEIMT